MSPLPDGPFELVEGPKSPDAPDDPRVTIVKKALQALADGEPARSTQLFDAELVYVVKGRSPLAGEHRGPQALIDNYHRLRDLCDQPPRFDIMIWLSAGPHVHCVGTLHARRGGRQAEFAQAHVFEVSDAGRIVSGRVYEDDLYAFDDFWT